MSWYTDHGAPEYYDRIIQLLESLGYEDCDHSIYCLPSDYSYGIQLGWRRDPEIVIIHIWGYVMANTSERIEVKDYATAEAVIKAVHFVNLDFCERMDEEDLIDRTADPKHTSPRLRLPAVKTRD